MGSVRKSIFYSLLQNYLLMFLQLLTSMILARILRPEEVGVFSVASALSALASVVRDFGVAEYLIQETDLTQDKIRAAFAINIMVSWTMGLAMFGGSFFVSGFYSEPGVGEVMRVLAFNFVLIPFGAVTMAYFRRQMNFAPGLRISIVAGIASSLLAIALGLSGFSYMSLAYSSLLGVGITVAMSMAMRPPELPRLPGLKGIREVLAFGTFASGIYIFGQLGRSAPDLIIGRTAGMDSVGFFSRANGLLDMFVRTIMSAVHSVALPYFSETRRNGGNVGEGFLKTVLMTTSIGWPFYAVSAFLAQPAIRFLYGPQWDAAVPLLRILCIGMAIDLIFLMATEVLLALSLVKRSSALQLCFQATRVLLMLLAAPLGLYAICYAIVAASVLNALLGFWFLRGNLELAWLELSRACLPAASLAAGGVGGAAVGMAVGNALGGASLVCLVTGGLCALATMLPILFLLKHPLADELGRGWNKLARREAR